MSLVIIGDTHGKIEEFNHLIERRTYPEDFVIQIGDMGMGFGFIPHFPKNVKWFRGNHDDPTMSRVHSNYLGDFGYLKEYDLFWMAGAWSIDWGWRQEWNKKEKSDWLKWKSKSSKPPRQVWWEDEELSQPHLDAALALYEEVKPSIVLSHEAPASIVPHVLAKVELNLKGSPMDVGDETSRSILYHRPEKLKCIYTRTSTTLQKMLEIYKPKHWCFGHYHTKKDIYIKPTQFHCCEELGLYRIPDEMSNMS